MSAQLAVLEAGVRDALARAGWRPRRLELISPLGAGKGVRYAYRVETDDGRTVKARQFGSDAEAQRVETLRRGIDDAFAPVLGRVGPVLIEAWLDGTMLAAADAEAWAQTAGAVLGRLHAHRAGAEAMPETAPWTVAALADVALLRQAGALSATAADRVRGALGQWDPLRARVGLIHKDFCAENMLIDARRRLRVIDTELIAVDPLAFDLGWTWHRWPMSPRAWERFAAGYRSTAPAAPEAEAYWRIATGLTLARVFLQRMPARLDAQLASLLRCVAGAGARA